MEPKIQYDFSFPSKSNAPIYGSQPTNMHIRHFHHGHNGPSMFKSGSTSLLSCAQQTHSVAGNQPNGRHRVNQSSNYCNSCVGPASGGRYQSNMGGQYNGRHRGQFNNQYQQQHSYPSAGSFYPPGFSQQPATNPIGAPGTPKDGNCSFTFDDLKNTLSFMDDSPLVNNTGANTSPGSNQLTVNPNAAPVNNSENLSLHSGGSSTSSSSAYTSCSNNSSTGLPKSVSNPMLLSTCSSVSSLSGVSSTSPVSMSSASGEVVEKRPITGHHHGNRHSASKSECNCVNNHHNQSPNSLPAPPAPTPSFDMFVRKSSVASSNDSMVNNTTVSIETAAKKYRFAAQNSEATCCWKGKLPPKYYKPPVVYSTKIFVGGLPWDICEADLWKEFGVFGPCRIELTNKERYHGSNSFRSNRSFAHMKQSNTMSSVASSSSQSLSSANNGQSGEASNSSSGGKQRTSPGFAYVIYDSEYSVRALVSSCIEDYQNGRDRVEFYYRISTRRVRNKEVQIIPWILADNNFATCTPKDLDPKKTVFVGNLHGTMTARDLAHIMNELFGSVVYAGIDIDKLKYPIGSGRVTFAHQQNFMRAVRAAFVDIQSAKFIKRIQIDPYLEDVQCCLCMGDKGIYFCRDFQCFNYYCGGCWEKQHSLNQMGNHKPLMRKREEK